MEFKEKLKQIRKEEGYLQKDVAKIIKMSSSGYANWEQGLSQPNIEQLKEISKLYNISIDILLNSEDFKREDIQPHNVPNLVVYTPEEEELLEMFNELSDMNKGKVLGYVIKVREEQRYKEKL